MRMTDFGTVHVGYRVRTPEGCGRVADIWRDVHGWYIDLEMDDYSVKKNIPMRHVMSIICKL